MIHIPAICCIGAAIYLILYISPNSYTRGDIDSKAKIMTINAIRAIAWIMMAGLYEWFIFH